MPEHSTKKTPSWGKSGRGSAYLFHVTMEEVRDLLGISNKVLNSMKKRGKLDFSSLKGLIISLYREYKKKELDDA